MICPRPSPCSTGALVEAISTKLGGCYQGGLVSPHVQHDRISSGLAGPLDRRTPAERSLAEAGADGELEEDSDSDPLPTASRRRFLGELARVVGRANRHGAGGALLFIDLKGLARINETHGRLAGDAALVHVARLLSGLIRATDIVARVGGDEFGLILDHIDHNSAIDTGERSLAAIAAHPVDLGGARVAVEARSAPPPPARTRPK